MGVLDIIVVVIILLGAFVGWKKGAISTSVSLIGSLLIFVLSFFLKNPLSILLYENLPFFDFFGIFKGITSLNILIYEGISYIICIVVLKLLLNLILKVTGILDKLVKLTIVLALPSKIIGFIIGAIEALVYAYVAIFIMNLIPYSMPYVGVSSLGNRILYETPGLSNITSKANHTMNEIYEVCLNHDKNQDKKSADYESLDILLKYDIITTKSVKKLSDLGKLKVENVDELITKYEKEIKK